MHKRFTIKTALLVTVIAAVAFRYGPWLYRRTKYINHYQRLTEQAANWERRPHHAEGYTYQARNGVWLMVSTSEHEVADDYSTATYTGATPDPNRFFVVPPGKWVDTIDDVFVTWDKFD
ncbi:hypothetical protein CA13_73680 [Planctomycetes bacterium CA13]|uniref:Uncharacterized protein n=1 Tax=Novipirellula herctigrandis TaxID=2527986 RepID=A0A5C5YLR4_9BACT|nr:hypothetical protein CA13_73680 [Planctomycetes bacterium CA13]